MILISVIIPVYNGSETIQDALDSIRNQTCYKHVHDVIVVNDGSTDSSEEIILKYKERHCNFPLTYIVQKNQGVSSARNRGVAEAESDFIAFLDCDDVWLPNKLERLIECINNDKRIDCIGSAYSNVPLRIGMKTVNTLYKGNVRDICISNFPQPSTVLMKRKVFVDLGGFDVTQRYAEDGNFFLRVAANYNLYYLPEKLIEYGNGKRAFGVKGLSANLKGMYDGNIKNLKEIKALGYITHTFYLKMRFYYFAKYIRRILLSQFN